MNRRRAMTALGAGLASLACTRAKPVPVGSKDGSESRLLGEILYRAIDNRVAGGAVRHPEMGRTQTLHQAMMMGEVDVCPEYTAAAHSEILKAPPVSDASVVFERVKLDYHNQFRQEWFAPLGFQATFVVVVAAADARFQAVSAISELAGLKTALKLAVTPAFASRIDGHASLVKAYAINARLLAQTSDAAAPLYQALAEGRADAIVGTASDGALLDPRWKILADDRSAFLPSQACMVARVDALASHPDLRDVLSSLSGKISNETMRKLNQKVDSGQDVSAVASGFLVSVASS
ncbi:MAG: hypothetical protein LLG20_06865 [Acidobacteriales bacterium]|nr:hypothetical protein [Terriglobales bacterium]